VTLHTFHLAPGLQRFICYTGEVWAVQRPKSVW